MFIVYCTVLLLFMYSNGAIAISKRNIKSKIQQTEDIHHHLQWYETTQSFWGYTKTPGNQIKRKKQFCLTYYRIISSCSGFASCGKFRVGGRESGFSASMWKIEDVTFMTQKNPSGFAKHLMSMKTHCPATFFRTHSQPLLGDNGWE